MKRALLFGPWVLLLACGPLLGQQPSGAATRDIRALYQGYMEAFNKKDVAKIMSFFVPGSDLFVFDVTPPRQHVGWADYKKDWEDLFAAFPGPLHQELSDLSVTPGGTLAVSHRSEEHTSELQSPCNLVCRLLLEKKKKNKEILATTEY